MCLARCGAQRPPQPGVPAGAGVVGKGALAGRRRPAGRLGGLARLPTVCAHPPQYTARESRRRIVTLHATPARRRAAPAPAPPPASAGSLGLPAAGRGLSQPCAPGRAMCQARQQARRVCRTAGCTRRPSHPWAARQPPHTHRARRSGGLLPSCIDCSMAASQHRSIAAANPFQTGHAALCVVCCVPPGCGARQLADPAPGGCRCGPAPQVWTPPRARAQKGQKGWHVWGCGSAVGAAAVAGCAVTLPPLLLHGARVCLGSLAVVGE